jgi:succinate dehydrogenase / fumarate reductase flavoprotein subunit
LGTNSLLDAVVFGERAGKSVLEYVKGKDLGNVNEGQEKAKVLEKFEEVFQRDGSESYNDIRDGMKEIMMSHCGVFRDAEKLKVCIETLKGLQERFKKGKVTDKGKVFNTEIYEIMELGNMLGMAVIIATAALERQESRGGHFRTDFPKRDDEKFLHHSMVYDSPGGLVIKAKPVVITKYKPAERTY